MKNYVAFVTCGVIGISLMTTGYMAVGQTPGAWQKSFARGLRVETEADKVIRTDLSTCDERMAIAPQASVRVFPKEKVAKTLNGIWRGRVYGKYDKKLLAKDGYLNVDYYMIIDAKRGEGLVFEQFSNERALPRPVSGTPTWSYLMCGSENYLPAHPAQVHEFQKVSGNVEDARALLKTSTGMTFKNQHEIVLSSIWQELVDAKYFDTGRSLAYAGALFKPFEFGNVPNEERGTLLSMHTQAEYRGGGMTAAKFESGVPLKGSEQGEYLGVSTSSGDYLVASAGNGVAAAKEASAAVSMSFDKVVIGPIQ